MLHKLCIVILILGLISCARNSLEQVVPTLWSKQIMSPLNQGVSSMATDTSGNLVTAGYPINYASEANDTVVTKYNTTGTVLWSKQLSSNMNDSPTSVAIDANNNIFVGGATTSNLFGTNMGNDDGFLVKLDPNGNTIWSKQIGTSSQDDINGLTIDKQGNVIACGRTAGSLFGSNTGPDNNGNPVQDSFLVKYSTNGDQVWAVQFGADDSDSAEAVAVDGQSNVLVVGSTSIGNVKTLFSPVSGVIDAYIAKYSPNGVLLWGKQFGTASADGASTLIVDLSNNIYVGGYENIDTDDSSDGGGYVSKFDSSGNQLWTQTIMDPRI